MVLIVYFYRVKISAVILLLAALAYWTETVRVPLTMTAKTEKPMCCKMSGHAKCGAAASAESGKSIKSGFPAGGNAGRNGAAKGTACPDCNNTANCLNCPLCYMATPPVSYHAGILYSAITSDYAAMPAGTPTDYCSPSWKPPDAGSFAYGPFII